MKEILPVKLNIYKLINPILSFLRLNIYHTAIEYADIEFAFGSNNEEEGIYDIKPRTYDAIFLESVIIGECDRRTFFKALDKIRIEFKGNTYNLLIKNCNHFTNKLSKILFEKELPSKYSRFLAFGDMLREVF